MNPLRTHGDAHIAILQFDSDNPPGYLARWLDQQRQRFTLLRLDQHPLQPLAGFDGYALMGGPMMVGDDLPWMQPVLQLLRDCLQRDIPVLGHCLGAQLLAHAAGARVGPCAHPEIGWVDVTPCEGPQAQQVLGDGAIVAEHAEQNVAPLQQLPVFHWHLQSFSLPPAAELLLSRTEMPQQAFVLGPHLGFQAHIEIEETTLQQWYTLHPHPHKSYPIGTIQNPAEALLEAPGKIAQMRTLADRAYGYWLAQILGQKKIGNRA
jgi:GMP synthase-like glutamine amidotransferase